MIKLKGLTVQQSGELLPDNLILLGYRGSIAHDMYVPKSDPDSIDDKDLMGVYIGPIEHYLGFGRPEVKERLIEEWDAVSYELRKYIRLLLKCNPKVMSLLWVKSSHVVYEHPLGAKLRANRDIFVTKAAYHSFTGYAYGQFKRMTHFNQAAREEMERLEAIISAHAVDLGELNATQEQRDTTVEVAERPRSLGSQIDAYKSLRSKYYSGGYMGAKRKELVKRFGYDAKNAAHLIRLLRMGIEFLSEGELHVSRADADNLLSIKRGEWPLEKVKAEAERLFRLAEEAYVRSPLPPKADMQRAEQLCQELICEFHGRRLFGENQS